MSTRGDGSNCRMCGTFFCKAGKSVSLWLAMFAAVAVNSVALAANINAGDNGYVFGTKDLNGDTRIVGGCVDIGCYESDL